MSTGRRQVRGTRCRQKARTISAHLTSAHGLPGSLGEVSWRTFETTGVPLRAQLGPAPGQLEQVSESGGSCQYPATDCVDYPLCETGGSTRPVVKQHVADTQMPGRLSPGRLTEAGQALNGGNSIYSNITIRGNTLVNGGRFVDVGAAAGVVVENNILKGDSQPSSNVRLYSSSGFDKLAMESANVCEVQGQRHPCVVDVV